MCRRTRCQRTGSLQNDRQSRRRGADSREQCTAQEQARKRLCKKLGDGPYNPPFRASNFVTAAAAAAQPNTYFPLIPGMRQVYQGEGETNVIEVLNEYKLINSVQCRTVHDTVSRNIEGHDVVLEDTQDWFAQDIAGNVWYCGEISQRFEYVSDDHAVELVGIGGSWKALREHAKPGVVMFAHPEVGRVYRQEFDLGNAEDFARIVSNTASYTAILGSCNGTCVVTRDYTSLEPDHVEIKVYSPGFGMIKEIDPETHEVVLELVEMSTPVVPM